MDAENPKHYSELQIQPLDIIEALNELEPVCRGNILKYVMRCDKKGQKLNDLKKARVYLDKWIEHVDRTNDNSTTDKI